MEHYRRLQKLPSEWRKHFFDKAYEQVQDIPGATVGDVTHEAVKEHYKLYDDRSVEGQVRLLITEAAASLESKSGHTLDDVLQGARKLAEGYVAKRGARAALDRLRDNIPNAHLVQPVTQGFYDKVADYLENR